MAVLIALDRRSAREGGDDKPHSAVQYVRRELGMPVIAVATLADLLEYLSVGGCRHACRRMPAAVAAYRERYGV